MLDNLRADIARLQEIKTKPYPWSLIESLLFENGFQAVVLHRMAHALRRRGVPILGPLIARLSLFLTGVDISPAARIGPGLLISHGVGLVIGGGVVIGERALLLQQVTIGAASIRRLDAMPALGDDVFVGAGARVIGGITVGSHVFIGTNAIVTSDVPDDCKVTVGGSTRVESRQLAGGGERSLDTGQ